MLCKKCNGTKQRPNGMPCELCEGTGTDARLRALIEDEYPGSCTALSTQAFAEKYGYEDVEVSETLDDMEIFECANCNWWLHPGEIYLGHAEDCEGHDEMVCGDCCQ